MKTKKINLFIIFICLFQIGFSQDGYPLSGNIKKDIKLYKEWFGDSYIDSLYCYEGSLSSYKKKQKEFLSKELNISCLILYGHSPANKPMKKIAARDKTKEPYKIPASVHTLELWYGELPLSFDLNPNQKTLTELTIYEGFAEKKDSILLNFSNLDSLSVLNLRYLIDDEPPCIQLTLPRNLRSFATNIPVSNIVSLPESLKELYIRRDSIYPFSIQSLPDLWLVLFYGDKLYSLPEELINKPSLKNIIIEDTLTASDIEILAKIPQLDTLTLVWNKKNPYPDNLNKLTNVSVIKLDFYLETMWKQRYPIAQDIHRILPNTTVLYKVRKYEFYNNKRYSIDSYIKY